MLRAFYTVLLSHVLSPVEGVSEDGARVSLKVGGTGTGDGAGIADGAGSIVDPTVGPAIVGAAEGAGCGAFVVVGSTAGPAVSAAVGCIEEPVAVAAGAKIGDDVGLVGDVVRTSVDIVGTCHLIGGSITVGSKNTVVKANSAQAMRRECIQYWVPHDEYSVDTCVGWTPCYVCCDMLRRRVVPAA